MRLSDSQLESILAADRIAALRADAVPAPHRLRLRLARLLVGAGVRLAPELRPTRRSAAA